MAMMSFATWRRCISAEPLKAHASPLLLEVCITIEVQKSNTLAVYRFHPGLQQRFPNFRVDCLNVQRQLAASTIVLGS